MSFLTSPTYRMWRLTPRAAKPSTVVFAALARPRCLVAAGIRRHATKTPPASALAPRSAPGDSPILVQQRLRRPLAPHLSIYRWQISSVPSTLTRITGVAIGGALYLFGVLYLAAPYLGLNMSSAAIAASFAAWPVALQVLTKFTVAWPLIFHSFNGLRYLCWDSARLITNRAVSRTGWTVVIASFAATFGLVLFV